MSPDHVGKDEVLRRPDERGQEAPLHLPGLLLQSGADERKVPGREEGTLLQGGGGRLEALREHLG